MAKKSSANPTRGDYARRQAGLAGIRPGVPNQVLIDVRADLVALPLEDRTAAMNAFIAATAHLG